MQHNCSEMPTMINWLTAGLKQAMVIYSNLKWLNYIFRYFFNENKVDLDSRRSLAPELIQSILGGNCKATQYLKGNLSTLQH